MMQGKAGNGGIIVDSSGRRLEGGLHSVIEGVTRGFVSYYMDANEQLA